MEHLCLLCETERMSQAVVICGTWVHKDGLQDSFYFRCLKDPACSGSESFLKKTRNKSSQAVAKRLNNRLLLVAAVTRLHCGKDAAHQASLHAGKMMDRFIDL